MKICFVKQDVYQDLYVCSNEASPEELLASSAMRVGPYGLFSRLHADFRILKEEPNKETQIYRESLPHLADDMWLMKGHTLRELPGMGFAEPGTEDTNGMFSVSAESVDWGAYDVVISVNVAIPRKIVKRFPSVLFCYMIGEANVHFNRPKFGYDCVLNQEARGKGVNVLNWVVDFPYTFLGRDCLESFAVQRFGEVERGGIYPEINMCPDRPVEKIPVELSELSEEFSIHLHRQNISENIQQLQRSKFFVKVGGRVTRGNGVVEAISAGCLALFRKEEVIHDSFYLKELAFDDGTGLSQLVRDLANDSARWEELQNKQRDLIEEFHFRRPLDAIEECLEWKRNWRGRFRSFFSFGR
ncbi:MAG: hypothetical protein AAGF67_07290 [Verrucomicrobiota bacterium]